MEILLDTEAHVAQMETVALERMSRGHELPLETEDDVVHYMKSRHLG